MAGTEATAGAAKTVSLAQVSPPRLYFALLHQRFSGTLQLDQPAPQQGRRTIWFDGGMPVFTDWVEPTDVLGQVLLELGYIGQDQLFAALEAMAGQGGLLGEVLLSQGSLDPQGLQEGLRKQCFRKLVHTFALRDGEVALAPAQHDLQQLGKINVLELIVIGVGAHYDAQRIGAELGPIVQGTVQATAALTRYRTHFRFRPTDEPILQALLEGSSLQKLTAKNEVSQQRAAQLIYALWACQMLKVGAAAQPSPGPAAGAPSPGPRDRKLEPVRAAPAQPTPPPAQARPKAPAPPTAKSATPDPAAPKPTPKPAAAKPAAGPTSDTVKGKKAEPADEAAFVERLQGFEARIEAKAHAFELLDVPLDAGRKELRRIWADLSKDLHPDSLHAKGLGHLRERVSNVFAAMSEAHGILSDKEQRAQLRDKIRRGEDTRDSADATAQARAAFESELIAKEGDRFLKANKFDRALEKFRAALELTPEEHDLQAAAAWCHYNLQNKTRQLMVETDRTLGVILAEAPALARAHFFRGMVQKELGAIDAALTSFETALRHDRRLIDAERQARALRVQRGQPADTAGDNKKPRGLKGFFSRR